MDREQEHPEASSFKGLRQEGRVGVDPVSLTTLPGGSCDLKEKNVSHPHAPTLHRARLFVLVSFPP